MLEKKEATTQRGQKLSLPQHYFTGNVIGW